VSRLKEAFEKEIVSASAGASSKEDACASVRTSKRLQSQPNRTKKLAVKRPPTPLAVSIRPWVRINGILNRAAFNRLLSVVLLAAMSAPGQSGEGLGRRLCPALLPAHTHELLCALTTLRCVRRTRLVCAPRGFLCREDAGPDIAEDEARYDPTPDCVSRFLAFEQETKCRTELLPPHMRH